jgi:hypothetical protein
MQDNQKELTAIGLLALILVLLMLALASSAQQSVPNNYGQPAEAPSRDQIQSALTPSDAVKHNEERAKESHWYNTVFDNTTDWLLVLFNGLLVAFTWALSKSTKGLWNAAVQQGEDTKESLRIANINAEAAKKSADLSERSLHELNRAFVFVKEMKPAPSATAGAIDVWIVWENNGTTQTKSMRTLRMLKEFDSEIPDDFDYPDDPEAKAGSASIGPRGTLSGAPVTLSSEMLTKIASNKRHLLVWGWIEYDDIFPDTKRHRTEFAVEIKVAAAEGGYSVAPVARRNFNGADEECGSRFIRAQKNRPRIVAADQDLGPLTQVATATVSDVPK